MPPRFRWLPGVLDTCAADAQCDDAKKRGRQREASHWYFMLANLDNLQRSRSPPSLRSSSSSCSIIVSSDFQSEAGTDLGLETDLEHAFKPSLGTNEEPGLGTNEEPGLGTNEEPGLGTNEEPGLGTNEEPALGTTKEPGLETIKEPGLETTEEPGLETTKELGLETTKEPGLETTKELRLETTKELRLDTTTKEPGLETTKELRLDTTEEPAQLAAVHVYGLDLDWCLEALEQASDLQQACDADKIDLHHFISCTRSEAAEEIRAKVWPTYEQ